MQGPKGETSRGLAYLDCKQCPEKLRPQRGCRRFGNAFEGHHTWKIDHTGDLARDEVHWCPASVWELDREGVPVLAIRDALLRACTIDKQGGLAAYFSPRVTPAELPAFFVDFFSQATAARDRWNRDVADAYAEVS